MRRESLEKGLSVFCIRRLNECDYRVFVIVWPIQHIGNPMLNARYSKFISNLATGTFLGSVMNQDSLLKQESKDYTSVFLSS